MKNRLRAGFTLLEMAIVLVIFGIALGTAMPSLMKYRYQSRMKETKARQERIIEAVAAYAVLHDVLPCPARVNADTEKQGISDEICADTHSAIGVVPYHTLGLTEVDAKDGFGRMMTYVVPPYANQSAVRLRSEKSELNICRLKAMAHISLKDKNNRPLGMKWDAGDADPSDFIVVLVIGQGRPASGELHPHERVNLDSSLNFYELPFSSKTGSFGQMVKWATLRNLMALYGRRPCQMPHTTNIQEAMQDDPTSLADPFGRSH